MGELGQVQRDVLRVLADAPEGGMTFGEIVRAMGATERRTVVIDRSPPRRVLAPTRYRSMKTQPDRTIWESCWQPVQRLLEEGWRLVAVTVDWGGSEPMTEGWRLGQIRATAGCYDRCVARSACSRVGRGTTTVEMER